MISPNSDPVIVAIASAVAYLRTLTDRGLDGDEAARQISFTLAIDAGQFPELRPESLPLLGQFHDLPGH